MPDPTPATNFLAPYGQVGFGVAAVVILVGLFVWAWKQVGAPALLQRVTIAEYQAKMAASMAQGMEAAERIVADARDLVREHHELIERQKKE